MLTLVYWYSFVDLKLKLFLMWCSFSCCSRLQLNLSAALWFKAGERFSFTFFFKLFHTKVVQCQFVTYYFPEMLLCFRRWFLWNDCKHNTATHFLRRMYFYHGVQCSVYWTNFQRWEQQEACSKKRWKYTERVFSQSVFEGAGHWRVKGHKWNKLRASCGPRGRH